MPEQTILDQATTHRHRQVSRHEIAESLHGDGFNRNLAVWVTNHVGSMRAAYAFTGIAVVGAIAIITNSVALGLVVALVSQTFLQLVLLPVLQLGQNLIAETQDQRAEADHETLQLLHTMNTQQLAILELLRDTAATPKVKPRIVPPARSRRR